MASDNGKLLHSIDSSTSIKNIFLIKLISNAIIAYREDNGIFDYVIVLMEAMDYYYYYNKKYYLLINNFF